MTFCVRGGSDGFCFEREGCFLYVRQCIYPKARTPFASSIIDDLDTVGLSVGIDTLGLNLTVSKVSAAKLSKPLELRVSKEPRLESESESKSGVE